MRYRVFLISRSSSRLRLRNRLAALTEDIMSFMVSTAGIKAMMFRAWVYVWPNQVGPLVNEFLHAGVFLAFQARTPGPRRLHSSQSESQQRMGCVPPSGISLSAGLQLLHVH
jgi:hypothetical protein